MSSGRGSVTLSVMILFVVPFKEIRWKGHLWIPLLFDGEHNFGIRADSKGITRLIQQETFSGLLLPFLSRSFAIRNRNLNE